MIGALRAGVHPPGTLRGRLVAVLALVLTIGFAIAALATVVVVRHVLVDRLDSQLRAAGDRFAVGLEHTDNDGDHDSDDFGGVEGQLAGTLGARLFQGRVTAAAIVGEHDSTDRVPAAALARLASLTADASPHSVALPHLGSYRITVMRGRDGDLQVTGLPIEPVEQTIDKLVVIESIVFAATLVGLVLASTVLVRLTLRPLARMADTAASVSELPLQSGAVSLPHRVPTSAGGSEIDTLATAFNAMLGQVESALQTRAESEDRLRRFVADASHELRTPVAVVRGHAELAQRVGAGATTPLPDEVVHSLERITAQAGRMGRLVEDLLLLARLDSGRPLSRVPVDVVRVALDALDDIRVTAADHRWRLHLPTQAVWVPGDAHALGQAIANLLANAATHTPAGTRVDLTVDSDDLTGEVLVHVHDDGPGMSTDLAEHAFDRFVRGEQARSLSRGSSGLGLPIAAAIVAAHDGAITLTCDAGGTQVRITLPPAADPSPDPENQPAPADD